MNSILLTSIDTTRRVEEGPVCHPLLAQIDAEADIVQDTILALQFPQHAALHEVSGDGLEPAPMGETTMRVHCERCEITHALFPWSVLR